MKTRQQFKKAVVEAIHGLPYEEAIKIENYTDGETIKKLLKLLK